jgi:aspartyl-tRNA(Asn)/glutamyl-tRNA(Gln) amidotransferase subunit A
LAVASVASVLPRLNASAGLAALVQPPTSTVPQLTISEASELLHAKKLSPVELTQDCLKRIERLNPKLNAFITITAESALEEARRAETEIVHSQSRGPLHGIPIGLKDLVDTAGVGTTAASGLFKNRVPTQDANLVRLLKAAGAVFIGKLNMHEFAYGGSSVTSYFGPIHNPWNLAFSPGGSSGGSAAAVATGLCLGAIGSDTGGSIREPAAYCSIVGLKPSYGRVSATGVVPLSWSLDHLGPMTRSVRDAALLLNVIAGYDSRDTASLDLPVPDFTAALSAPTTSLRIGILRAHFYDELDPEILHTTNSALSVLQGLTKSQKDDLKIFPHDDVYSTIADTGRVLLQAESFAYHQENMSKSPDLYQPATLQRIRIGSQITTTEYVNARRKLDELRRSARLLFENVDLVVTPTCPVPPFAIEDLLSDPATLRAKELQMLRNTRPFNILGLPTISVPCGFTSNHLPIGLQISGPPGDEETVLRLAHAYEEATSWHKQNPPLQ